MTHHGVVGLPGLTDGASVKAVEAAMKVTEAIIASAESFESESAIIILSIFILQMTIISRNYIAEERIINNNCYIF